MRSRALQDRARDPRAASPPAPAARCRALGRRGRRLVPGRTPEPFQRDAARVARALPVDGEVAGCDAELPARFVRHAWSVVQQREVPRGPRAHRQPGHPPRQHPARRPRALARPRWRSRALQASFGVGASRLFDFDAMSRLLSPAGAARRPGAAPAASASRTVARGAQVAALLHAGACEADGRAAHEFEFDERRRGARRVPRAPAGDGRSCSRRCRSRSSRSRAATSRTCTARSSRPRRAIPDAAGPRVLPGFPGLHVERGSGRAAAADGGVVGRRAAQGHGAGWTTCSSRRRSGKGNSRSACAASQLAERRHEPRRRVRPAVRVVEPAAVARPGRSAACAMRARAVQRLRGAGRRRRLPGYLHGSGGHAVARLPGVQLRPGGGRRPRRALLAREQPAAGSRLADRARSSTPTRTCRR